MESSSEGLSIHDSKKVLESLERRSFCCSWFPRFPPIWITEIRMNIGLKSMVLVSLYHSRVWGFLWGW